MFVDEKLLRDRVLAILVMSDTGADRGGEAQYMQVLVILILINTTVIMYLSIRMDTQVACFV